MRSALHLAIVALFVMRSALHADPAAQTARWQHGRVNPAWEWALDKIVIRYQQQHATFESIEKMRPNGVPAAVVCGLLEREQSGSLRLNPAQGDSLQHKTVHVPRGRIPGKEPPYTFLQAAEDAYYSTDNGMDHLQTRDWSHAGPLLDAVENFNGGGYRKLGLASPYVWQGVIGDAQFNYYLAGKYVADGKFDRHAKDQQPGVAAILMRLRDRGIAIPACLERPTTNLIKISSKLVVGTKDAEPLPLPLPVKDNPAPATEKTAGDAANDAVTWLCNFLLGLAL